MKKLIALVIVALMTVISVSARDKIYRDDSMLPTPAKELVKKYFGKVGINHVKVDKKTFGGADYDVVLNNGTEIDFNADGVMTEIDCGTNAVPDALILKPIRDYVAKNFKNKKIVSMEVNRSSYDIELIDGTDLKFDRAGKFLKIDD